MSSGLVKIAVLKGKTMKIKLLSVITTTILLSGCSGKLTDVNHKWCPLEQQLAAEEVVEYEKIDLSADALFQFGKYSQKDMQEKGRRSLQELADRLNSGYAEIYRIKLVGHTDRLGSEQANYKLGLNRAETVKNYLRQYGIQQPIEIDSAGESQPVTIHCIGQKASKGLTECLQPDRRVTVEIKGLRKSTTIKRAH